MLDVNDNAPRFRPFGVSNFTEKILEGAQPGTTLLSVSAVDPDKGPNGQVIYQLLHLPRGGYVRLEDPSTGMTTSTPQLASIQCQERRASRDKLTASDRGEKSKQLEAVFTRAR